MHLRRLWLGDFRSYAALDLSLGPGLTAVVGANGQGKTNLLEAIVFLARLESFRGVPHDALVRAGADRAIVRGEATHRGSRSVLIECEIPRTGRVRSMVNRQRLPRARDLLGSVRVTVFAPDDLDLVKGGPSSRRVFLDDTLISLQPRLDACRLEVERVLKQRNALLRSVAGTPLQRVGGDVVVTLDVWDAKLAVVGEELTSARERLITRLEPVVAAAYEDIAGSPSRVSLRYERSWGAEDLRTALAQRRGDDIRRGVTSVGPHRDDIEFRVGGLPARTHASQGEQRTLTLALRLATHRLVADELDDPPILLLDDVFSELDEARADALVACLPDGQTLVTTATGLPESVRPEETIRVGRP